MHCYNTPRTTSTSTPLQTNWAKFIQNNNLCFTCGMSPRICSCLQTSTIHPSSLPLHQSTLQPPTNSKKSRYNWSTLGYPTPTPEPSTTTPLFHLDTGMMQEMDRYESTVPFAAGKGKGRKPLPPPLHLSSSNGHTTLPRKANTTNLPLRAYQPPRKAAPAPLHLVSSNGHTTLPRSAGLPLRVYQLRHASQASQTPKKKAAPAPLHLGTSSNGRTKLPKLREMSLPLRRYQYRYRTSASASDSDAASGSTESSIFEWDDDEDSEADDEEAQSPSPSFFSPTFSFSFSFSAPSRTFTSPQSSTPISSISPFTKIQNQNPFSPPRTTRTNTSSPASPDSPSLASLVSSTKAHLRLLQAECVSLRREIRATRGKHSVAAGTRAETSATRGERGCGKEWVDCRMVVGGEVVEWKISL